MAEVCQSVKTRHRPNKERKAIAGDRPQGTEKQSAEFGKDRKTRVPDFAVAGRSVCGPSQDGSAHGHSELIQPRLKKHKKHRRHGEGDFR